MNSEPFVSVLLPTYNGRAYLTKAVESVMRQTYRDFELLIIDDGSSDDTPEIIKGLSRRYSKITVITHEKNMGFVKTLNEGVEKAQGVCIARIDDDDVWCDERKLKKQATFLEEHLEYGLVGGGIIHVDERGKEIGRYLFQERDEDIRSVILADNVFAHSAVMFRKNLWKKVGGYQEKFHFFSDWALWLALGNISKFYNFPEYNTLYLEKEYRGDYGGRNTQIRRKIWANLQLAWTYRKDYPGFWKSCFLSVLRYVYSYMPFRHRLRFLLNRVRIFLIDSPGYTFLRTHNGQEQLKPLCVMGAGYVGLVTGVCFAEMGNQVLCVDRDIDKIEFLSHGVPPFYEPLLEELLRKNLSEKRIRFTADIQAGVQACDI